MGNLVRIQGLRMDLPREHPEMERLYPPKLGQDAPGGGGGGGDQPPVDDLPSNVIRWALRKPAAAAPDDGAGSSEAKAQTPTPPAGMPVVQPEQ